MLDFGCWVGLGRWRVGSLLKAGRGRKTQRFVWDWHAGIGYNNIFAKKDII